MESGFRSKNCVCSVPLSGGCDKRNCRHGVCDEVQFVAAVLITPPLQTALGTGKWLAHF
jgi:hypothetical protein